MKPTIGFVGLGLMGGWLVKHLLKDGYSVHVYDVDPKKIDELEPYGAIAVKELQQLPQLVNVVILSLPNSTIVAQVIQGMNLYSAPAPGLVILDTSTADPSISTELATSLEALGMYFMDATVSGTSEMCAAKDTIFMVGGPEEVYQRCAPIFLGMGRESVYMGKSGTGAAIKLVVNLVLAVNRVGLAEGLTLAKQAGIDQLLALEVLKKSAAFSKAMDQKGYRMVHRDFYPPIGHMTTHYKDVQLMVSYASKLHCPVPVISFTAQALASEMAKRPGDRDSSAIICFYDDLIKKE
jgi:3-hydroxyisobutyrate dehydrogenase-like beta-hydroxyacid dehydrogenase